MYQTCHCVVTCNGGLNNDLNTESSNVSIKGILTLSWMILLFCEDPVVGSLTSLECALDRFRKLSYMAEEVFGEDVFSSGRKKGKQNKNVSGKKMTLFYHNVSLQFTQLSLLRAWHWIVIFVSQNTVSLNEQKVKPGVPLCLDFDLNAYIRLSNCNPLLNFSTFTTIHSPKRNNTKGVFAYGMFNEVSIFNNGSNYSHMIFFQVEVNFSLFFSSSFYAYD